MSENLNIGVGALLIGTLVTSVGFGITTMQTLFWFRAYPNDPKVIRYIVWSIFCLDLCHIMFTMHMIYYYLILNYNNPTALSMSCWSFDVSTKGFSHERITTTYDDRRQATVVLTVVITCLAHGFSARRVYILGNRNWFLVISIAVLSLVRLVCGCIITAKLLIIKVLSKLPHEIGALAGTGLGAACLADWIITVSLVYFLRRKRLGFNRTDNLLDRLTYWTINSGLLTGLLGLAIIVTSLTHTPARDHAGKHDLLLPASLPQQMQVSPYANALLATLNHRPVRRGRGVNDSEDGTGPSLPVNSPLTPNDPSPPYTTFKEELAVRPTVHIETTTITDVFDGAEDK
ncbi:uncharacterized protein FIBRA_03613 [Fibroporia radiculosa]|uniref:DUF6534 domain-containing protein n=1 Tax=Fibroporia radiculosa TaxID=599839 RepID=J4H2H9_9APHY|nr:uncharacterized protein FIBRA_03613 [Fibroporia radiculosa]CCM01554.1 predicted protein [Fibroporia radiculosa]